MIKNWYRLDTAGGLAAGKALQTLVTLILDCSSIVHLMGLELPFIDKVSEMYWEASEVERVFDELKKRDKVVLL